MRLGAGSPRRPVRLDLPQAIGLDELHSVGTDGHSALGVGLGVLVDQRPACDFDHAAGDEDLAAVQVDICHLRPQSPPRRAPRTTAKRRKRPSSGSSSLATSSSRATPSSVGRRDSAEPVDGAVACLTGWAIQP